ncbi:hypothetical protein GH714_019112 [Hevea brasiliensis]|uniref:K Homology domain-containing protein n=1 Tax=Hevea brasiliensis TaxID=3981 RepID=A0A6A6LTU9_HEVBR|nr:hypothetical protein GH714_019112 [Hevea brasiliensis]
MNPAPSVALRHPEMSVTAKRSRDEFEVATVSAAGETEGSASKRAKSQDIIFRIVVPSRQIGKSLAKRGVRHEERVIIISSKESDNSFSDAENALKQIATLILKEDDSPVEASKVVGAGHVAANTIRMLIAVLAPNQLPLCASAHESDRVLQISGDVPVVLKALEEIGCQLRENPPKQVISISPTYNYAAVRPTQPYVDPTSAAYVTLEMMVSETLVGGLIGRCGSNISRIRNESGAMIKVYGGKGEQKHRHIQFGGTAQQVALAKQRVDEYIYSQLVQQAGAQAQPSLGDEAGI